MKQFNNIRHMFRTMLATATVGVIALTGCTTVDDTLGSNLIPGNQEMKVGVATISGQLKDGTLNPKQYFETRLFQTDSIISSNITYGYMGSTLNDTLGLRAAGFLSQYICYYKVDGDYFGYRPIFDSAQIMLSVKSFGGDTLVPQTFVVYEVIDNKYITEKPIASGKSERDSTFYLNFNPETQGVVASQPLFTFVYPNGTSTGPATAAVTMTATDAGRQFIKRLMLQEGEYKENYSIYSVDSLEYWVKEFKGLYITPQKDQALSGKGAIFSTKLDASGFSIYGRNRVEGDESLIKDTIGMVYYFYDTYATHGNLSINTISHDYSKATAPAAIKIDDARESNKERPLNSQVYVEGMGGVITEMTFTEEFFKELEAIREKESTDSGKEFSTMAFSQVRMSVYFTDGRYDWREIGQGGSDVNRMVEEMNGSVSRLGMYTSYKKLTAIADYPYTYEATYSATLAYGGYPNRSRGCYVMDITAYIQGLWNSYDKEAKAAQSENRAIDWEQVKERTVYIGPEAYGLYSSSFSLLQGMTTDVVTMAGQAVNAAPIKIDLTYNMIK